MASSPPTECVAKGHHSPIFLVNNSNTTPVSPGTVTIFTTGSILLMSLSISLWAKPAKLPIAMLHI